MVVEVHLYGRILRRYHQASSQPGENLLRVDLPSDETLAVLLKRLGIPQEEINHIFYNSRLFVTRNQHADLYDLPQTSSPVDEWDLGIVLNSGDRIGLFGMDIPMLSM